MYLSKSLKDDGGNEHEKEEEAQHISWAFMCQLLC